MNFHLMFDEKFLDAFIQDAEKVAAGKNKYLFTFNPPAKLIKYPHGIFAPYGSEVFKKELSLITAGDRLYIHWFDDYLLDFIKELPHETTVFLFFWGGDLAEQTVAFYKNNYEKITSKYLHNKARKKIEYFPRNPLTYLRRLIEYNNYKKKIIETIENKKRVRQQFLSRLNSFCHWNKFDYEDVINAYGGQPVFRNFFYEAGINSVKTIQQDNRDNKMVSIWLGNSASYTNNHLDALPVLGRFKNENIRIIAPLNYGDIEYGQVIHAAGQQQFGGKWFPLLNFMPLNEYIQLWNSSDVVVMFHNRTQAAGNIFSLVKMGKKVYLKKKSSIYKLLKHHGIFVFEAESIVKQSYQTFIQPLTLEQAEYNFAKISKLFSDEYRIKYLHEILN